MYPNAAWFVVLLSAKTLRNDTDAYTVTLKISLNTDQCCAFYTSRVQCTSTGIALQQTISVHIWQLIILVVTE